MTNTNLDLMVGALNSAHGTALGFLMQHEQLPFPEAVEELAGRLRALRMHGETSRYHHRLVGGNFRLDELQAAILLVKFRHLEEWTIARQRNADHYDRLIRDAGRIPVERDTLYNVVREWPNGRAG